MSTIRKTITNIISPMFLDTISYSTKLGRWKIEKDNKLINCKIDQANEDHCGCCVNEFTDQVKLDHSIDKQNEEYIVHTI